MKHLEQLQQPSTWGKFNCWSLLFDEHFRSLTDRSSLIRHSLRPPALTNLKENPSSQMLSSTIIKVQTCTAAVLLPGNTKGRQSFAVPTWCGQRFFYCRQWGGDPVFLPVHLSTTEQFFIKRSQAGQRNIAIWGDVCRQTWRPSAHAPRACVSAVWGCQRWFSTQCVDRFTECQRLCLTVEMRWAFPSITKTVLKDEIS